LSVSETHRLSAYAASLPPSRLAIAQARSARALARARLTSLAAAAALLRYIADVEADRDA